MRGSGDRAGGSGIAEPVVLTLAQGNHEPPEQLVSWAEEVTRQSDGSLQIEFANLWREGETDAEIGTVGDVRDGAVDLAWVGARAFDRVGVLSFQPLLAPLLVDSHDLQEAVFEDGLPTEMLDSLGELGLEGVGIFPGPMRKVLGITHPFLEPADFAGQVVGIGTSDLAAHTMESLGATPSDLPTGARLEGLDGMDQQLDSILGNNYALRGAGFVTANVNLWPRPIVVFMNADRFDALTDEQQAILHETVGATVDDALADSRAEDADAVAALCQQGLTFSVASADDLAALRDAVAPVYEQIAAEDARREWLERITEIKEQVGAPPDTVACPETDTAVDTTDAGTTDASSTETTTDTGSTDASTDGAGLEGTYTWTITDEEAIELGEESQTEWLPCNWTMTLDAGEWRLEEDCPSNVYGGTYEIFRDQIVFTWFDGGELAFNFAVDEAGNVTLTPDASTPDGDAFVWSSQVWERVGD